MENKLTEQLAGAQCGPEAAATETTGGGGGYLPRSKKYDHLLDVVYKEIQAAKKEREENALVRKS